MISRSYALVVVSSTVKESSGHGRAMQGGARRGRERGQAELCMAWNRDGQDMREVGQEPGTGKGIALRGKELGYFWLGWSAARSGERQGVAWHCRRMALLGTRRGNAWFCVAMLGEERGMVQAVRGVA